MPQLKTKVKHNARPVRMSDKPVATVRQMRQLPHRGKLGTIQTQLIIKAAFEMPCEGNGNYFFRCLSSVLRSHRAIFSLRVPLHQESGSL